MPSLDTTPATWQKSTYSYGNGACVEVADAATQVVRIRDSKNPDGAVLSIPRRGFAALIRRQQRGS